MADEGIAEEADGSQQQLVIAKGNTKAFEFLKLLPEIRNKIYWNVLVGTSHYYYFFIQPPLTRVNRQIRSESLPMLYGNNRFIVDCVDGCDRYKSFWKFPQLRRRWRAPPQVPAVSALPNFDLVTKLDLLYAYEDEGDHRICSVDINICMRNKKPDYAGQDSDPALSPPGEGLKSSADVRRICYNLLEGCVVEMSWSGAGPLIRVVLQDLDMIAKSLLFFARKCPLATGCVLMVVRAKESSARDLEEASRYELLVSGPPKSGSEGSSSEESGPEGSGLEESGSEDSDSEGSDSGGSGPEGSCSSEGSGSEESDSEGWED